MREKNMTEEGPFPEPPSLGFQTRGGGFVIGPPLSGGRGGRKRSQGRSLGSAEGGGGTGAVRRKGLCPHPGQQSTLAADRAKSRAPARASSKVLPWSPTSTSREPLVSCWLNRAVRRVMGRARPGQREFISCWISMARARCSVQSGKVAPASSVPTRSMTWAVFTPSICRTGL